jgi:cell fate regulator YaaT (PSP1 superfamily)
MGCAGCSSEKTDNGLPRGCKNHGTCSSGGCDKLSVFNYLSNMQDTVGYTFSEYVEVRFKNTRKQFFRQSADMNLKVGEPVAVDCAPGHDVGTVSLTGDLVLVQLRKNGIEPSTADIKNVLRRATQEDIDLWQECVDLEESTRKRARVIARELGLDMKVSDVEYRADKKQALFYYTSDGRVDFRELVRKYSDAFKVRVEMRQIGARQEAARLGGLGTCGRELCCSTWLTDFRTVTTGAARYQQLSLNPDKLAGQCGKLKCCLNYELDSYMDAIREFPSQKTRLETRKGSAFVMKIDIFKGVMFFAYKDDHANFFALPIERVKEIMAMNKAGEKPNDLIDHSSLPPVEKKMEFENVVGQDDLTRFDRPKGGQSGRNKKRKKRPEGSRQSGQPQQARSAKPQNGDLGPQQPPRQAQGSSPQASVQGGERREGSSRNRGRNRNRNRDKGPQGGQEGGGGTAQ